MHFRSSHAALWIAARLVLSTFGHSHKRRQTLLDDAVVEHAIDEMVQP